MKKEVYKEKMSEKVRQYLAADLKRMGRTEEEMCRKWGISPTTWYRRKQDPYSIRLGEWSRIQKDLSEETKELVRKL